MGGRRRTAQRASACLGESWHSIIFCTTRVPCTLSAISMTAPWVDSTIASRCSAVCVKSAPSV
eukprot:4507240-Prymnesium_polylepis.2